jgi:hypothetical protein
LPIGFAYKFYLELKPQSDLARQVPCIFCGLLSEENAKRVLTAYVGCRRCVVGMVQHVGKRRLKRSRQLSRIAMSFAKPALTAIVPGASSVPTPAFPTRPAFSGV